jgi:hypothetical protein
MSWEQAKQSAEGSSFLKFKDGESISIVFRGEPYVFYQKYPDKAEYTEWTEGRTTRFKLACVVKLEGEYQGKIFGGGRTVLAMLSECNEEYGMDCAYKVKRKGSGTDTTYTVLFQKKLTEEDLANVNAVDVPKLTSGRARQDDDIPPPTEDDFNQDTDKPQEPNEEIPF